MSIPGLTDCCSDNYGAYPEGYGFAPTTYSCQDDPVIYGFHLLSDTNGGSSTDWSTDYGFTLTDTRGALVTVADVLKASGAAFELNILSGSLDPDDIGGSSPPYAAEDGKQVIAFIVDYPLYERREALAEIYCDRVEGSCEHNQCDIIVAGNGEDSAGNRVSFRYTLSDKADPGVVSLQYVFAHEFGHTLGLGHPTGDVAGGTIMANTVVSAEGVGFKGLYESDIQALRFLYGKR